ncbi:hypothetical protein G9A89_010510 [Geosiphon pyriformis]|nr:hypothetical protein G9A89_010510 [Geosiphon pyriformis]
MSFNGKRADMKFYKSILSSIPGPGPISSILLNNRALNGKSKQLIDLKQDINFFRELKLTAHYANLIYCPADGIPPANPNSRLEVGMDLEEFSRTLIVYFKGPELTKDQWATRSTQLVPYEIEQIRPNQLVLVEKEWQNDFLAVHGLVFSAILNGLIARLNAQLPAQRIFFVGHAIGGAYATIAGLTWRIESLLMDSLRKYPQIKFSALKISTITFGAPRMGNVVFARLVNQLLKVQRITYFNDYVPHFPPHEVGNILLEHFETEYWILPSSCECLTEENNGEYSFYECRGFDYGEKNWKHHEFYPKLLYPEGDMIMSGENEECNAGQSIDNVPGDFIHKGPYFGRTNQLPGHPPKQILTDLSIGYLARMGRHASYANLGYCVVNNGIEHLIANDLIVANVVRDLSSRDIIVYFKGDLWTKAQLATRRNSLVPFIVDRLRLNPSLQIDRLWFDEVLSIKDKMFNKIRQFILEENPAIVYFIGHGVGGAYAVISALLWKIETDFDYPKGFYSSSGYQVVTFGQPRIGNTRLAQLINEKLIVNRITHTNDFLPHYPPRKYFVHFLSHHETELWLGETSCECSQDVPQIDGLNLFLCKGYNWERDELSMDNLYPSRVSFGENEECNAGQIISDEDEVPHMGPYFGVTMNDCSNFSI